ncbi:MAG: hypothetical protein ACI4WQ_02090 [Sharpea porci]
MIRVIGVVIVIAVVMMSVISQLKGRAIKKLVSYLENGDYDSFNTYAQSKYIKFLIPRTSLMELRLNGALIEQDTKEINSLLKELTDMPLLPNKKQEIAMKGFNYFIGFENKKEAKKYLKLVNEGPNDRMKVEAKRVYNIYVLKNDDDLKDLLEEINDQEDYQKGVNEFLVSLIYQNKGDKENAKKYEDLSKEHLAMVDELTAQNLKKA